MSCSNLQLARRSSDTAVADILLHRTMILGLVSNDTHSP